MSQKYHKIAGGVIELEIIPRSECGFVSFVIESFLTDKHQFRAIARYSDGHMEWQWCESYDEAMAWCKRFSGLDMVKYIKALLDELGKPGIGDHEAYRAYGALECALIVAGVLEPGKPFEYQEKEAVRWFFLIGRRKERYGEMIKRLARAYVEKWYPENCIP